MRLLIDTPHTPFEPPASPTKGIPSWVVAVIVAFTLVLAGALAGGVVVLVMLVSLGRQLDAKFADVQQAVDEQAAPEDR